jgi:hypothetical protein
MTRRMKRLLIVFAVLAFATAVAAEESLTAAKNLYESAAYEDALSALTRLQASTATGAPVAAQIDQYRAFCLFALGRTAEAQSVAESLIAKDPLLELDEGDASPRIVAMFADVRKRLLPGLTRDQYRAARAALDRKDFAAAESQLIRTRRMLEEAQKIGASDETMGDLRVLVDGFLDLTRSAVEARATNPRSQGTSAGVQAASPPTASSPAVSPSATGPSLAASAHAASTPKTPAQPLQVYDSSAADVLPPVALHQAMPAIPPGLATMLSTIHRSGALDVIIDQQGNVERAVMRESVHPIFDALVVEAARSWKYRPALKDDVAVRYLKTIAIVKQ